jgi:predicted permease
MERELAEEMKAHREMMPPDSRPDFGNHLRLWEESREAWSLNWLEHLFQDLAYGARVLRHSPGFTLGAVAVLSLGVGVNLAEFQIFHTLIFHRLNVHDAGSVLRFSHVSTQGPRPGFPTGAVEFYREHSKSFDWLVSEDTSFEMVVEEDAGVRSNLVSADYFDSLRIVPAWGRLLDARDAEPGAPAVAVLGYQYWQARWGADPKVVGRVIRVNGQPVQIVGVVPYSFDGLMPRRTAVWVPGALRPLLMAGSPPLLQDFSRESQALFGNCKAGVSQAAAEAELTSLTRELIRTQPGAFRENERIQGQLVQGSTLSALRHPAVAILLVMILLVLLSACANLGSMLLARGVARQREIGIRAAVGASRGRLVRQLMTENFLLATLGTVAGLVFGVVAARLLLNTLGAPPDVRISIRWPVLVVGVLLTFVSAFVFGLPAALQTVRSHPRTFRLRQALIGVQVAVSCLLLIASALLAHSGISNARIDLAFDWRNMVVVYPQFYTRDFTATSARQKLERLSSQLGGLPGVAGVTAVVAPPLGGRVMIESVPDSPIVCWNAVASSYFEVMNLSFLRGRTFLPHEKEVVVVSESAARALWPDEDPIDKTWNLARAERTVVGVVKDSGANLLVDPDSIEAYVPIDGATVERSALVLHSRGDPGTLVRLIPASAAVLNETVSVTLMSASRENFLEGHRRLTALIGSVAAIASALAAAGMFALVAFMVAQRRRELGIRIAMGARPRHVLSVLLTQNAMPTAIGVFTGIVLAFVLSRLVRSLIVLQNRDTVDVIGFAAGLCGLCADCSLGRPGARYARAADRSLRDPARRVARAIQIEPRPGSGRFPGLLT